MQREVENSTTLLNPLKNEAIKLSSFVALIEILRIDNPRIIDTVVSDLAARLCDVHHKWESADARQRVISTDALLRDMMNRLSGHHPADPNLVNTVRKEVKHGIRKG